MNYPGGQGYSRGGNNPPCPCSPYSGGSSFTSNRPNMSAPLYQYNDCSGYEGQIGGGGYNASPSVRPMTNGSTIAFPPPWNLQQQAQLQNMQQFATQPQQQQQQPSPQWNDLSQMKESASIGCMPTYPPSGHPTPGSPSSYNSMNRRELLQQPIYPSAEEFSAYYNAQGSMGGRPC